MSLLPTSLDSGLKRTAETSFTTMVRPLKKPHLQLSGIFLIPDLIHKILSYLPFQSILNFERLSTTCQPYTEARWKELTLEEQLDFDWAASATVLDSIKYRYILGKATMQYAQDRSNIVEEPGNIPPTPATIQQLQRIYHRYEGLMIKFPPFGAFVWNDLSRLTNHSIISQVQKIFVMPNLKEPCETGGELLLKGLSQLGTILIPRT